MARDMSALTRTAALAAAVLLPAAAGAQATPAPRGMSAVARAELVDALPRGATFQSGAQTYRVVGGLRAAPPPRSGGPGAAGPAGAVDERLSAVGATPSDLVEEKGGYLIYRTAPPATGAPVTATVRAAPAPSLPVVVNARTGRLGVAASVLVVRLGRVADAAAVAAASGLSIDFVAERIGTAFYGVPEGRDVVSAAAAVARDPRVKSAEVEVREHFPAPL